MRQRSSRAGLFVALALCAALGLGPVCWFWLFFGRLAFVGVKRWHGRISRAKWVVGWEYAAAAGRGLIKSVPGPGVLLGHSGGSLAPNAHQHSSGAAAIDGANRCHAGGRQVEAARRGEQRDDDGGHLVGAREPVGLVTTAQKCTKVRLPQTLTNLTGIRPSSGQQNLGPRICPKRASPPSSRHQMSDVTKCRGRALTDR